MYSPQFLMCECLFARLKCLSVYFHFRHFCTESFYQHHLAAPLFDSQTAQPTHHIMSKKSHPTEKRFLSHCNPAPSTKYVPLCRRFEPPSPTRKVARIQPLVAATSSVLTQSTTHEKKPQPSEVNHAPSKTTVFPMSSSSAPSTPDAIPRPKIIPPLPPLTVYIDRVVTHPTLLRRTNRSTTPGLRRFRSKSASIIRQPSFSCIPEKDEELESVPKVQFSLHSPPNG